VFGVVKAYTTRVGDGPFPTELLDDTGAFLQKVGFYSFTDGNLGIFPKAFSPEATSQVCNFSNVQLQMCNFSNVKLPKCETSQICNFPNVKLLKCETSQICNFPNVKLLKCETSQICNFPNVKLPKFATFQRLG